MDLNAISCKESTIYGNIWITITIHKLGNEAVPHIFDNGYVHGQTSTWLILADFPDKKDHLALNAATIQA